MPPDVPNKDTDLIEIPSDMIQLGTDPETGMPRAEPTEKALNPEQGSSGEAKPGLTPEEIEALQKDRDTARDRAVRAEADAADRTQKAREAQEALEAEKARVAELGGKLHTREGQVLNAHYERIYSHHQTLTNAIANTETMALSAEREYVSAHEASDPARMAKAQREMARLEAERVALESGKSGAAYQLEEARRALEQAAQAPKEETKPDAKKDGGTATPAAAPLTPEQWIDQQEQHIGADGTKWLKDHKDFVTDQGKNRQLLSFATYYSNRHGQSALKGKEFLDALNKEFGLTKEAAMTDDATKKADDPKPNGAGKATPAAPVGRSGNVFSSSNLSASQVRLPPKLAQFVKQSGLDPVKYALETVDLIKKGELPKNWLDPDYPH